MHDLAVLTPVDESGRFYDDYGWLHGLSTVESADQIVGDLDERGLLVEAGTITPPLPRVLALPHAAHLPDLRRLVHLGRRRSASRCGEANATVEWTPEYMGKRMDDWLVQHGRLEHLAPALLRAAAAVLPVRLRAAERDRLAGRARASARTGGLDELEELRRPWIDAVPIRCEECGEEVERIPEVGDVWLDAGIVPFSTLGWQNPEWVAGGLRDRRRAGAHHRRPARPRLLGAVVPGRLGLGDARADPALVLLAALHVGRAHRPGAVPDGARLREDARRARPRDARLVGQHDRGRGRVRAHGRRRHALAVLRAAARPEPPLRLRPGAGDQAQAAHALELGRVPRRLREHRGLPAASRRPRRAGRTASCAPLDRWLVARTQPARRARRPTAYEAYLTVDVDRAFEAFVDDLSELVHPPLAAALLGRRRGRVPDALVRARAGAARGRAGDAVPRRAPLAEPRRRRVRATPASVFLAGWPERAEPDEALLAEIAEVRRVVELGRQARDASRPQAAPAAAAARRRGRDAAPRATRDEIADELRVKEVAFGEVEATRAAGQAEPAGARARGSARSSATVRAALAGRRVRGARRRRLPRRRPRARRRTRCSSSAASRRAGRSRRTTASTVALDTDARRRAPARGPRARPDPPAELDAQGRGLEITDRIASRSRRGRGRPARALRDRIADETLAVAIETDGAAASRRSRRRSLRPSVRAGLRLSRRRALELAAELDREAEVDVLVDERYGSICSTPRARNQSHTRVDELLRRRGARRDRRRSRRRRARPRRSRSRRRSGARATPPARATSTSRFEFELFREPITSSRSTSREHLLDRPLAVRGRVADVLLLRRVDRRGSAAGATAMISAVSSTDSVVCVM